MVDFGYEMKKTKSVEAGDRLSELPDSLILKIFEFLPTRDVVRTPILSSRWNDLWTISSFLCFHAISYDDDDDNDELRRFVNRTLLRWRGARVQQFKVSGAIPDASIFPDMDLWLRFAVDNRVEDLDISFRTHSWRYEDKPDYIPPKCLYSCPSLQKLSLNRCILKIKGGVEWSRLKSLSIESSAVTQEVIDQVFCGSPLLEEFFLNFHGNDDLDLIIKSSSLKKLSICQRPMDRPSGTALRILTPNLLVLTLSGDPCYNCDSMLENVSSLARANLLFDNGDNDLAEILPQILRAIQHVEGLTISDPCFQVLRAMRSDSLLPPFLNVKFLSLNYYSSYQEDTLRLLEIFPKLKTLVVIDDGGYFDSKVKFKPNPSNPFLAELNLVEVTWWRASHPSFIFPFIKILLKHASKLEKLVFRVERTIALDVLYLASKELLGMPRSSPRAKMVFHEY